MPQRPHQKLFESFKSEKSQKQKDAESAKLKREIERLIRQIESGKL